MCYFPNGFIFSSTCIQNRLVQILHINIQFLVSERYHEGDCIHLTIGERCWVWKLFSMIQYFYFTRLWWWVKIKLSFWLGAHDSFDTILFPNIISLFTAEINFEQYDALNIFQQYFSNGKIDKTTIKVNITINITFKSAFW